MDVLSASNRHHHRLVTIEAGAVEGQVSSALAGQVQRAVFCRRFEFHTHSRSRCRKSGFAPVCVQGTEMLVTGNRERIPRRQ